MTTKAFLTKAVATEEYALLLQTDVFDLDLEDRLNDVLEVCGVELFTEEYDVLINDLQEQFLYDQAN